MLRKKEESRPLEKEGEIKKDQLEEGASSSSSNQKKNNSLAGRGRESSKRRLEPSKQKDLTAKKEPTSSTFCKKGDAKSSDGAKSFREGIFPGHREWVELTTIPPEPV